MTATTQGGTAGGTIILFRPRRTRRAQHPSLDRRRAHPATGGATPPPTSAPRQLSLFGEPEGPDAPAPKGTAG